MVLSGAFPTDQKISAIAKTKPSFRHFRRSLFAIWFESAFICSFF
jgi:hypothetical protein